MTVGPADRLRDNAQAPAEVQSILVWGRSLGYENTKYFSCHGPGYLIT